MKNFFLKATDSVVVIVDIQERLADAMTEKQKVITNCVHLIEAAKLFQIPIVLTEQYPKGLGQTVSEIKNSLPSYDPIEKITFSCCKEPLFINVVSGHKKKNIILAGMETHVCVLQTCLELLKEGYNVHLVNDAVCSRSEDDFRTGIELMRDA